MKKISAKISKLYSNCKHLDCKKGKPGGTDRQTMTGDYLSKSLFPAAAVQSLRSDSHSISNKNPFVILLSGLVLAGHQTDKSARQVFWLVSGLRRLPTAPALRRHSDDVFGKPLHETYSSGTVRDSHPVPFLSVGISQTPPHRTSANLTHFPLSGKSFFQNVSKQL